MTAPWQVGSLRPPPAAVGRWVVKFGGSLLTRPAWPAELLALVASLPGSTTVVAGGGPLVDGLRAMDAACPQPDAVMHDLAIEALGITARLVAKGTGLPLVDEPRTHDGGSVLATAGWLARKHAIANLPASWDVTSDSIAAVIAREFTAALVLAKRVPPPTSDLLALARSGWVDVHLPVAAGGLEGILWAVPQDESGD